MLSKEDIQKLEEALFPDGLSSLSELFPGKVVFSSSLGPEDQVITDFIFMNKLAVQVFTIDTGRLFPETYDLLDRTVARYNHSIQVYFPEAKDVEEYVSQKGINGFYESFENRLSCCEIRKVNPLKRALSGANVWVTGLRAAQSGNRGQMQVIEWDDQKQLYKYNPLLHWTNEGVWNYIHEFSVPVNTLHASGFVSIGCAPCTRAIEPGEDPRAGRWWWETSHKECGLHSTRSNGATGTYGQTVVK